MYKIFFIFILISLTACKKEVSTDRDNSVPNGTATSENSTPTDVNTNFGFADSEKWSKGASTLPNVDMVYFYNDNQNEFKENINVSRQDVGGMDLEQFTDISIQAVKTSFNGELKQKKFTQINGKDAAVLEYSFINEGKRMNFIQHYYVKNDEAFVITYSADDEDFAKVRSDAEEMMNSFTF